jgi:hypothetical protein
MSLNTIAINQRMDKFDGHHSVWLFGYGSLIFKADFPYIERRPASIAGWTRRFWQGSHDHRGTEAAPGRVATLVEQAGAHTAGMAYLITPEVFAHLDHREKNGYLRGTTSGRRNALQSISPKRPLLSRSCPAAPPFCEALADQVGPHALPAHALAEIAVVFLAAAHFAHAVHHALRAVGEMRFQPFLEQRIDFPRQPQHHVVRADRARVVRGLQDLFRFPAR